MATKKKSTKAESSKPLAPASNQKKSEKCTDPRCPKHGKISLRGRSFEGDVTRKTAKTVKITWTRYKRYPKYERYAKVESGVFAHLPDCMSAEIKLGDHVKVTECRPLSKTKHFVVIGKVKK